MLGFNAEKVTTELIEYLRDWFNKFGKTSKAVIGISGGKDSTVAAALLTRAIGPERVIGVMMPNGKQADIADSIHVCDILGIDKLTINISDIYNAAMDTYEYSTIDKITEQLKINLAPRIRMMTLYAVAQGQTDGPAFVVNTCNRSEDYVGYSTKYGDAAGDIAVLQDFMVTEILQIGDFLGLPNELVHKTPSDGLCGKTDEDNLGFTYADLDKYIKWKYETSPALKCPVSDDTASLIERKHMANLHKLKTLPSYDHGIRKELL